MGENAQDPTIHEAPGPTSDRCPVVQLRATALSVRVFYQSASTIPCGIRLVLPQAAINQTMPAAAVKVTYVLLIRTQQKEHERIAPDSLYNNKLRVIILSVPDP